MNNLILINKSTESIVESVVNGIEEGNINPIEVAAQLKRLEDLHKTLKTKCTNYIVDELYTSGASDMIGYRVEKFTTGERLDYSSNEDWSAYQAVIEEMKSKQLPIEQKMKAAYKNGCSMFDEETGETFSPAKYKSGGKDTFKVTKCKK